MATLNNSKLVLFFDSNAKGVARSSIHWDKQEDEILSSFHPNTEGKPRIAQQFDVLNDFIPPMCENAPAIAYVPDTDAGRIFTALGGNYGLKKYLSDTADMSLEQYAEAVKKTLPKVVANVMTFVNGKRQDGTQPYSEAQMKTIAQSFGQFFYNYVVARKAYDISFQSSLSLRIIKLNRDACIAAGVVDGTTAVFRKGVATLTDANGKEVVVKMVSNDVYNTKEGEETTIHVRESNGYRTFYVELKATDERKLICGTQAEGFGVDGNPDSLFTACHKVLPTAVKVAATKKVEGVAC